MDQDISIAAKAIGRFEELERAGRAAITARRKAWQAAKEVLIETLTAVVGGAPKVERGLYVTHAAAFEHFDGVQLSFGAFPTGISLRTPNRQAWGFEHGPTLVFGQSESGLVVVVRYPAETTLPGGERESVPGDFVEAIEPTAIAGPIVLKIVTDFIEWAPSVTLAGSRAGTKQPIGFVPQAQATMPREPG
ncbi:MAG TPA: hypothetical protein VGL59_00600 [Polyangia bacterium]|jgi:hypothetical protein